MTIHNFNVQRISGCLLILVSISNAVLANEIRIGVRAHHGADEALQQWQPTADYLSKKIPEHTFVLIPYEINSLLNQAASRKEFDFVLTNPAAHIEQKIRFGVTPIATLINNSKPQGYTRFGTVIFTRADRSDINELTDLTGKSFMGADEQGFGGWRAAWYELLGNGVDPYKGFSRLSFGGGNQYNVVFAVRDGTVDAGSVRTDMLERMAKNGQIRLADFKVLGAKKTNGFEFLHSTPLYPEWPFAKLDHTSQDLARKVAAVLYGIPADSRAAIEGEYVGWSFPIDYSPVDNLLRELRVGPYKRVSPLTWSEVLNKYWQYAVVVIFLFFTVIVVLTVVARSNKRLRQVRASLETEIVERKKADEELMHSRRMLQIVIDTIPVRVFWKDSNLVFLGCNKLFAQDSGLHSPGEIIGKTDYDMRWFEQADRYRSDDQEIMRSRQSKLNFEEPGTTASGEKIWLEISKIPLTDIDGNTIGILGTYTDITERKRGQAELEEYKNRLEENVADRTAALEASNKELESYSYSIAHDLRAPLRSMIGFSQILAEDAAGKLNNNELDALERIVSAGKRMADLIDDILELSRITRSEFIVAPVNISDIARQFSGGLSSIDTSRKIKWLIQDDMLDKGDKTLLTLLIQNLIDNACKFTRDVENPTIEIGQQVNGTEKVYYVRDNGIGFDMQYAEKVFQPFQRLHADEFDGTGIGLATVQRIVQRHGGAIWAEANPNRGAEFHFTLNAGYRA